MSIYENNELTPREHMLMENENEQGRLIREHAVKIKELEIQLLREKNEAATEIRRLEAKWSSLLKIPTMVVKLPIFMFLGIGFIVSSIRGIEPSKDFWTYIK